MKIGKISASVLICAALLTGCSDGGQAEVSVTQSALEAVTESVMESIPETSVTEAESEKTHPYMEHVMAFKTSQYLEDEYGKVRIIRSPEELEEFGNFCERPDDVADYGSNIDFDKNVVAVNIVYLSSGSYDFEFYYSYVSDGLVNFEYKLIGSDVMTDDIATLYMFAEIPSGLICDPYPGENIRKYSDNLLSFQTNAVSDSDMYNMSIIRSSGELAEFGQVYGVNDEIGDFGDSVDFEKNVIAARVLCLPSGGYDHLFHGVNAGNGVLAFDYRLIEKHGAMTDDEAALFMFAEIPAEAAVQN